MDRFEPTSRTIEPGHPDYLAGAVLHSLTRDLNKPPAWGIVRSLVLGVLSFGLLPLLAWPRRFRDFIVIEQQQLWHLAEWVRLRSGHEEAVELAGAAERIRFRPWLWGAGLACVAAVVVMFAVRIGQLQLDWEQVLDATYRYGRRTNLTGMTVQEAWQLFVAWTGGLSAAYLLHWVQIQLHASALRRFVEQFNRAAKSEGLSAVELPASGPGLPALWLAAGVVLAGCGAVWGLPMMLCGAFQRRYVRDTSLRTRRELARRVRGMLLAQRPAMNVPTPVLLGRVCPQNLCRAALSEQARFCPRCGTRVKGAVADAR